MKPMMKRKSLKQKIRRLLVLATAAVCMCAFVAPAPTLAETVPAEGTVPAEETTPAEETVTGCKTARVFDGTLDSADTMTVWEVAGQEDVPYVQLNEYLTLLHSGEHAPAMTFAWEGNTYIISRNGQSIRADLDTQSIRCEDWRSFQGPNAPGALPAGIVEKGEFIALRPSEKHASVQSEPEGYEIRLSDYGFGMIRRGDDVLMPFALAQSAFGSSFMLGVLGYNGDDFFNIAGFADILYGNAGMTSAPNPYSTRWYNGSFSRKEQMSDAYARYNYAGICMLLDLTYGHREEKGIARFDTFLEEQGLKEALLSGDPTDDTDALEKLFSVLFDSGHDGTLLAPSVFRTGDIVERQDLIHQILQLIGYDTVAGLMNDLDPLVTLVMKILDKLPGAAADEEREKATEDADVGPDVQELIREAMRMTVLKPLMKSDNTVEISGDTAVVYFENFQENLTRSNSFYTMLPTREDTEKSTFALAWYAFEQIKKNGNVKKVVFDVSNNGGGSAAALVSLLGFLSEDGEVNITYRDLLNRSDVSEYYHVDTNLDGAFDDRDGYGGQYDFYILTSGSSYSCGTAFPYFAQRDGLAKIIGQKPGGGDCVVAYYVDAAGRVGALSGFLKLGTLTGGEFVSDEDAVEPDLPLTDEEVSAVFFHADKIAEYLAAHAEQ